MDFETVKNDKSEFEKEYTIEETREELNNPREFRTLNDSTTFFTTIEIPVPTTGINIPRRSFIAPCNCAVIAAYCRYEDKATNAGDVTFDLQKFVNGSGSGTSLMVNPFNMKLDDDVTQTAELVVNQATLMLLKGDCIGIIGNVTPTGLGHVSITVVFKTDIANLPE